MSLKDIRIAAETRLATLLSGEHFSKLDNLFNVASNPEGLLDKGYGVLWSSGRSANEITRKITTSGRIIVVLTCGITARPENDMNTTIDDLYGYIDTIIASFFNATFLNIPSKLLCIDDYSLGDPILLDSKMHVQINISFDLRFRTDINY